MDAISIWPTTFTVELRLSLGVIESNAEVFIANLWAHLETFLIEGMLHSSNFISLDTAHGEGLWSDSSRCV